VPSNAGSWLAVRVEPRFHRSGGYGVLLLLLTVIYVVGVSFVGPTARTTNGVLAAAALLLALTTSHSRRGVMLVAAVAIFGATVLQFVESAVGGVVLGGVASLLVVVLLSVVPVVIMGHVFRSRVITTETVLGLLCVYVVVGIAFAYLYQALDAFYTAPFFAQGGDPVIADFQYFSFVTQTTLGYGDLTPAINFGRSLAVLQALLGQLFLVTMVARFVGLVGRERVRTASSAPDEGDG